MNIKEFDYDTKHGFAWILVETDQANNDSWTVQCCLADRSQEDAENGRPFEAKIICGDCGHDWGNSGDTNEKPFKYWGENRCMSALFQAAKSAGLEVVGF